MIGFYAAGAMGSGGDPSPPDFPGDISGMILRLRAASLAGLSDGDPVATWADIGPNSHSPTQASAGSRPTYRADGINGKPAVEFDGTNGNLATAFGTTYSQPNTVFAVVQFVTVPPNDAYPWMDGSASTNRHYMGSGTSNEFAIWAGASSGGFLDSGIAENTNPQLVRGVYNGSSSQIALNSGTIKTGSPGTQNWAGITLGSRYDNARYVAIKIAEIVAYNGTLSAADIERVEAYLRREYSMPAIQTFGSFSNSQKWAYGVLASNGMIYGTPYRTASILKVDPTAPAASTFSGPGGTTNEWIGLIEAADGRLFGVPARNSNVLVIDPSDDSYTTFPAADYDEYYGGALADNGLIYCCPLFRPNILKIDPATNSSSTIGPVTVTTVTNGQWGWFTKDPVSGKLYAAPRDEPNVLVVDPSTDAISYIATGVPAGLRKFTGGIIASTGEIWMIPRSAETFLVVDPATDTARTVGTLPAGADKWNGGTAYGDWIVMYPRNYDKIVAVNAVTEEIRYLETGMVGADKWCGSVDADGKSYLIPLSAEYVGVVDLGGLGL